MDSTPMAVPAGAAAAPLPTADASSSASSASSGIRQRPSTISQPSNDTVHPSSGNASPLSFESGETSGTAEGKAQTTSSQPKPVPSTNTPNVGKTRDGQAFIVPHTPDMLSSIFDPREPKTPLDFITIASLTLQIVLYFVLPRGAARWFFFFYFAFWRAAYDAGLGHILKLQSEQNWMVKTVKARGWFDQKRNPASYKWVRSHLETKMEKDYNFEACPIDYNIWIFFRSIVDIILLNDFVAYSLFAFSCTRLPEGHSVAMHVLRWTAGWALIFFNLWVKMDAHRVVKDYAWYWGDCFFLITKELVFDGIYECAPDPMYSVGYAGMYGLSLVSGSYAVLFVSLAAHFAQYLFMCYFENPHIERTYGEKKPLAARVPLSEAPYNAASASAAAGGNAPANSGLSSPRHSFEAGSISTGGTPSATDSLTSDDDLEPISPARSIDTASRSMLGGDASGSNSQGGRRRRITTLHDLHHKLFRKDAVVYKNLDPLRGNDFLLLVAGFYAVVPLMLPSDMGPKTKLSLYFLNAVAWRIFHTGGLGLLLRAQSQGKWMVRHFIKHYNYDDPSEAVFEAFGSFKTIYNASLVMVYSSFALLCWRCYAPFGRDWTVGTDLLRHTLGGLLVALHVWAANSSYKVLGPFGWFYGDFFIDEYPHQLYYTGIYRFLNNPERSMGGAAWFGLVLISGSKLALSVAIFSYLAHWMFLSCVENPHMKKLYGEAATNRVAGVSKQLKGVAQRNSVWVDKAKSHPAIAEMRGTLEKVQKDATTVIDDFVRESGSQLAKMREEGRKIWGKGKDRLLIVRVGDDVKTIDRSQYSCKAIASPNASSEQPRYHLGEPVAIEWNAAAGHSKKDWIGIYLISRLGEPGTKDEKSNELITRISSQGSWISVSEEGDDNGEAEGTVEKMINATSTSSNGQVVFKGARLPWKTGLYEARYHHDNKQDVLARSAPFEIYVSKPSDPSSFEDVYTSLGQIVLGALEGDELHSPRSQTGRPRATSHTGPPPTGRQSDDDEDDFTIWNRDQAIKIAKGIKEATGVELSADVVVAEANIKRLANDVVEARRLLQQR